MSFIRKIKEDSVANECFWGYLFIVPAFAFFAVFLAYPIARSIIISFTSYNVNQGTFTFVGLQNYLFSTFKDFIWWKSLTNTAIYTVGVIFPEIALALAIALAIHPLRHRSQTFFRAAFYLPGVASGVVMALVWMWMFYPLPEGLFNYLLGKIGLPSQLWLARSKTALLSLILMNILGISGGSILLFGAGLAAIPKTLYEAASIDAASGWSKLRNITFPLLKPTTLYVFVMGLIGTFQVFTPVFTLTEGGPAHATTTLVYRIYELAFMRFRMGPACAQAVVLMFMILAIALLQFKVLGTKVEY